MNKTKAKILLGLVMLSMGYNLYIEDPEGFLMSSMVLPLCILALIAPDKKK